MKLLLVEDDDNKRAQIIAFVDERFPNTQFSYAKSLHSGVMAIRDGHNIVILDMTLPAYDVTPSEDGFITLSFGGREFLEQLDHEGVTVPVVILTGFDTFGEGEDELTLEELDAELKHEFPNSYVGSVWYSPVVDSWKSLLYVMIAPRFFAARSNLERRDDQTSSNR